MNEHFLALMPQEVKPVVNAGKHGVPARKGQVADKVRVESVGGRKISGLVAGKIYLR